MSIDDLAWICVRIIFLIQALMFEGISKIYKPTKLGDQIDLLSRIYSAWYIFETPKEEIPEMIQDELITIGRFYLGLIFILGWFSIMKHLKG